MNFFWQASTSSGGGRSADEVVDEIANDMIGKLPNNFNIDFANKKYPVGKGTHFKTRISLLISEVERYDGGAIECHLSFKLALDSYLRIHSKHEHGFGARNDAIQSTVIGGQSFAH